MFLLPQSEYARCNFVPAEQRSKADYILLRRRVA
jgi:hypothetical protein